MAADMLSVLILEDDGVHVTEDLITFYFNCLVSAHIELRRVSKSELNHRESNPIERNEIMSHPFFDYLVSNDDCILVATMVQT